MRFFAPRAVKTGQKQLEMDQKAIFYCYGGKV